MTCPHCRQANPERARFCLACGHAMTAQCPGCGAGLPPDARFCIECGTGIAATTRAEPPPPPRSYTPEYLARKILTVRSALEGERKLVSVLFCDLADSTGLAIRLGPEAMHALLDRFFAIALAQIHRYEGTINQFLGDGFMALFGAPIAHEDHARRAVLAALGIHRSVRERQSDLGPPGGAGISLRMGINTGAVVVGRIGDNLRMDYTAVGDTTNVAARLQQVAETGAILVSESTARLVRGHVRMDPLAPLAVKGKVEPLPAYRVLGVGPRRSPLDRAAEATLTPFVGRRGEIDILLGLLDRAEQGSGQVVGIVGEPGVGKSRLLLEFFRRVAERRLTYLEGRCVSYGGSMPYLPILDLLRHNCGIVDTDTPEQIAAKVAFGMAELGLDTGAWGTYLVKLLGLKEGTESLEVLSPEAIKAGTMDTLRLMSLVGSRRRPIVVVVEDCHWIDRTSEEVMTALVEDLAGAAMLLISTYRPGYRPPWMDKSYATQLSLPPLAAAEGAAIIHALLPELSPSAALTRSLLATAEGNPFFIEELARAMQGPARTLTTLVVPETIPAVIAARIDRLPDESKRLLQTASVLGRECPRRLLTAVWASAAPLDGPLRDLVRHEFLYERADPGDTVYVFKHALTQETAYEMLLGPRRARLHVAAAQAIESMYADRLPEVFGPLAYHYARTEDAGRAVEYLVRVGDRANATYAVPEAVTAYRGALAQVDRLPPTERHRWILRIVPLLAEVLALQGDLPASRDLMLQHEDEVERIGDAELTARFHAWLGMVWSLLGDRRRARASAERARDIAARGDDRFCLGRAHYVLATEHFWAGDFRDAEAAAARAAHELRAVSPQRWLGFAYWVLGMSLGFMGEFARAHEAIGQVDRVGETIGDPRLRSIAAWCAGLLLGFVGEHDDAVRRCAEGLAISPDPLNSAFALGALGQAYVEAGLAAEAVPRLEEAAGLMTLFGFQEMRGWYTVALGDAHLMHGDLDRARSALADGLEISRLANSFGVAWGVRIEGRLALACGQPADAAEHLSRAADMFASLGAPFELGRTRLELAVLYREQGEAADAAAHLVEAHRLFAAASVPRYVERAERLAQAWGVALP